ncbi:hypothetical protein Q428_03120 [Fervidicella metallireducens AeB]|uniref:non-specific serine/threonine protein kinase n=1 Tax=Fervidicella metallireducens AeB TaxID=1403537 RepID=A0A017RZB4_9CLOT|nr:Stk1 family PASTA domain-containing Ser/Thr kinase [Fervidicella metallireducens]EYE89280.1 hypothetical protein Q428_03120 [Fervidicella metallireducens AeB]
MSNFLGKILADRYILLEKIGDGGMSLVYKARCQTLDRYVAIKILRPEFTTDNDFIMKFKRESQSAASLSHPNIVGIYDVGEQDGIYYIVMEYVNGKTLKDYIKQKGKLQYEETLNIINQIALALDCAHKKGIVHRDIKPHNILITEDKIVKVTDFGIARASSSMTMTNTGTVMGSVHYFSPEQARGGFTDHRTDIYSLGVVMYEMLTGKLPYDAESPVTVALKHIEATLDEPIQVDASIPKAVNDIVVKSMQKDMTKRYQNVKELIQDINKAKENPHLNFIFSDKDDQFTRVIPIDDIDRALNQKGIRNNKNNEYTKKKRNKIKLAVLIMTLVITVSVLSYFAYEKLYIVGEVQVPKIIGLSENEAKNLLEQNKLNLVIDGTQSSQEPEGVILSCYPNEGEKVKENATIKVIVSSGPKKVAVPDLRNIDLELAKTTLASYKLELGNIDYKSSDNVSKGLIIEHYPSQNEMVLEGTKIDVVISTGPEKKMIQMPVLIGSDLETAKRKLEKMKLVLGDIIYDTNVNYVDGVVINQDINPGDEIPEGTVINITVNKLDNEENTQGNQ